MAGTASHHIWLGNSMQLQSLKTTINDDDDGHYTGPVKVRGDGSST